VGVTDEVLDAEEPDVREIVLETETVGLTVKVDELDEERVSVAERVGDMEAEGSTPPPYVH
jgi:hypothetical protein